MLSSFIVRIIFPQCSAEVLHHTGVMDEIPRLSEEQSDFVNSMKGKVLQQAENFRVQVRRRLKPSAFQKWVENDRMGALGLAGGALVGTIM